MSFLSSLVPPRTAINLLHNRIEARLGFKVAKFVMHFDAIKEDIFFDIEVSGEKRKYPFDDGKKYIDMGKNFVQKHLEGGDTIDYVLLEYNVKGPIIATVLYTTKEGKKQQQKTEL